MLQDDALGDGQSESCSADFPRPGLVDAVESLIYFVQRILRDPDAGILDAHIEVIGIRIDRHSHLAVVSVVLDGILYKIRDDHGHLDFVDLRIDLPDADHSELDIPLLGNGADPSEDQLHHFIDVDLLDAELGILAVHSDQRKKLRDDLVLSVDLVLDVHHKLPVHLDRHVLLLHEGVGQDLHRCHGSLELVGHVGYEFLSRFIQRVHTRQDLVEGVRDMFSFHKGRRLDGFRRVPRPHGGDLS